MSSRKKILYFLQPVKSKTINFKSGRMGRPDKVSLWCVSLLINTRFRFFILE